MTCSDPTKRLKRAVQLRMTFLYWESKVPRRHRLPLADTRNSSAAASNRNKQKAGRVPAQTVMSLFTMTKRPAIGSRQKRSSTSMNHSVMTPTAFDRLYQIVLIGFGEQLPPRQSETVQHCNPLTTSSTRTRLLAGRLIGDAGARRCSTFLPRGKLDRKRRRDAPYFADRTNLLRQSRSWTPAYVLHPATTAIGLALLLFDATRPVVTDVACPSTSP